MSTLKFTNYFKFSIFYCLIMYLASCGYNTEEDINLHNDVGNSPVIIDNASNFNKFRVIINKNAVEQIIQDDKNLLGRDEVSLAMLNIEPYSSKKFKISTFEPEQNTLDNYLDNESSNVNVISIISLLNNNIIEGFLVYYIDNSKMYLQIDTPQQQKLFQVNGAILQDILFIQEKYWIGYDIAILTTTLDENLNNNIWNNTYNDISLYRWKDKYFTETTSGTYTLSPPLEVGEDAICGTSHVCRRGGGPTCDAWKAYCRDKPTPICGYEEFTVFNTESESLLTLLPANTLYNFRNKLNETINGQIYVNAYYEMSKHFSVTLDLSLVMDIIHIGEELNEVINRYLTGSSEILFDNSFYIKLNTIAEKSKANSESEMYKELVDIMLLEIAKYQDLTVAEVKIKLNN